MRTLQNAQKISCPYGGANKLQYSGFTQWKARKQLEFEVLGVATRENEMGQLGPKAIAKVGGQTWEQLRAHFLLVTEQLLAVSPDAYGELTTTYIKFTMSNSPMSRVYAAMWVKNSKSFTVGFALPEDFQHFMLTPSPKGMIYKGLNKYLTITPADIIPAECGDWAESAFQAILAQTNVPINVGPESL